VPRDRFEAAVQQRLRRVERTEVVVGTSRGPLTVARERSRYYQTLQYSLNMNRLPLRSESNGRTACGEWDEGRLGFLKTITGCKRPSQASDQDAARGSMDRSRSAHQMICKSPGLVREQVRDSMSKIWKSRMNSIVTVSRSGTSTSRGRIELADECKCRTSVSGNCQER
jgi:hypothetical protein